MICGDEAPPWNISVVYDNITNYLIKLMVMVSYLYMMSYKIYTYEKNWFISYSPPDAFL